MPEDLSKLARRNLLGLKAEKIRGRPSGTGRIACYIPQQLTSPGRTVETEPSCLGLDRVVTNLASALEHAGARTIEATVPDRTATLVVHEREMNEAFAALGKAVVPGAAVSVRGELVRIETDDSETDAGCALLSISTGGAPDYDAVSSARTMIEKQRGFLTLFDRLGTMGFSLYLPILH